VHFFKKIVPKNLIINPLAPETTLFHLPLPMHKYALLLLLAALVACKRTPTTTNQLSTESTQTNVPVPADFEQFYQKFHADSQYQVSHIAWPLAGTRGIQHDSATTGVELTQWQLANWRFQQLDGLDLNSFERTWEPLGDALVIERIRAKAVKFGLERRFAKRTDGDWELIYYADVHELK
jgi:hypothetical protein